MYTILPIKIKRIELIHNGYAREPPYWKAIRKNARKRSHSLQGKLV
jgi:hypothetical protein